MRQPLVENQYYHIYNRGNGKRSIFLSMEDYDRFMKLLYVCNSEKRFNFRDLIVDQKINAWDFDRGECLVEIVAWVLMPNHFHLLLRSPRSDLGEKGMRPITKFMRKISTAYVMYFNRKYGRTGSLFEGKFKSKHVSEQKYYNYLLSYIHLNPIKLIQSDWKTSGVKDVDAAKSYLREFPYSSFPDLYMQARRACSGILALQLHDDYFKRAHVDELFEWISSFP